MSRADPVVVTVLRHGAVEGRENVFRGTLDEPLSAEGACQMRRMLSRFSAAEFDGVATSPLKRCHDFASAYAAERKLPLQVWPQFAELAFGAWEGLTPEEAAARNPIEYQAFRAAHGEQAPPNGESLALLRARVAAGWHEWLARDCGANRLLLTHAGVMRALLMELFGFTPAQTFQIAMPQAACLRISCLQGYPPFLLSIN